MAHLHPPPLLLAPHPPILKPMLSESSCLTYFLHPALCIECCVRMMPDVSCGAYVYAGRCESLVQLEAMRQRSSDEGLSLIAEAWTLVARAAVDAGQLRIAQNAAAAAVAVIPDSAGKREVRGSMPCVPLAHTPAHPRPTPAQYSVLPGFRPSVLAVRCSLRASYCSDGSPWRSVCGPRRSPGW